MKFMVMWLGVSSGILAAQFGLHAIEWSWSAEWAWRCLPALFFVGVSAPLLIVKSLFK